MRKWPNCFTAEKAKELTNLGKKVILVRQETSPEDIEGMVVSEAIVTSRGGMTSHAAVVARGMGTCCVTGCESLTVNEEAKQLHCGPQVILEGTIISVDGSTGKFILAKFLQFLLIITMTFKSSCLGQMHMLI